ncbi:MAG: lipopolysaccharide heptosyltransferase II [Ignavibacteriae bacterium]|nr:lipopolysaccharide heptosyltransferase II [Ignavibacteriota bacterium]
MALEAKTIVVIQTAFLGDVILTLPLLQVLKRSYPTSIIDFLVAPRAAGLVKDHPAINEIIVYDKRDAESGIQGLFRKVSQVRERNYDLALIPHRSLRSASLAWMARIPRRIGFHTSAGRFLLTHTVRYTHSLHEVDRNLALLSPLGIDNNQKEYPSLYPLEADRKVVDDFLLKNGISNADHLIAIAPGTVWYTKRWLQERFIELAETFVRSDVRLVLIGSSEDAALCKAITLVQPSKIVSAAGTLTLLQSAELIRRCQLLICNDSAPMHIAVAVRTPVVAIFGATVPEFGFAPYGEHNNIVEKKDLPCRPCSIHGGDQCPIRTFVCMKEISAEHVYHVAMSMLDRTHTVK